MPSPARRAAPAPLARALAAIATLGALGVLAPRPAAAQPLPAPAPEVGGGALTVPAIPSFALPPGEPGVRSVRELRVRGRRDWLATEITVRGYITWIYDCLKDNARPGEAPAQTQKRIDDDQTLCERPKFYLGDTRDASRERSIWVVGVPRPPTKLERKRLPPSELAKWPAVPRFALGDYVAVTGAWELQSPHGDRNSDGLLVFKSLQPARSPAAAALRAAERVVPAAPAGAPASSAASAPAPPRVSPRPAPAPIDPAKRAASLRQSNAGARAYAGGDLDAAIREYKAAVATWPENHQAWYGLAGAYARKLDWAETATAAARAARLVPDAAMYHLLSGVALYERAAQRSINYEAALVELVLATHLNDDLWRAHYYRGRIYRDRGDEALAAESLTKAVRRAPPQAAPYVALAELYRRWDYLDQAIEIARLGAATLAAPEEQGDALYVLGAAHDDKREDAAAIDAYTKALDTKPSLAPARFMRAQVLLRMKQPAAAKADLEAFLAHPGASAADRAVAQQLLAGLARRKP
jgi:tetratricopeptide (TPR) repeat protein